MPRATRCCGRPVTVSQPLVARAIRRTRPSAGTSAERSAGSGSGLSSMARVYRVATHGASPPLRRLMGQVNAYRRHFSEREIVALAAVLAAENFYNRINRALEVEAQGFCTLPTVTAADRATV